MTMNDGSVGIRHHMHAREIVSENIVLEIKTLPFSQWLPVYAFEQRHLKLFVQYRGTQVP